jgi:cystathionine beta-lyase family protein involved in aluminum resistance
MVGEARKGGLLVAEVMRREGYATRAPDTDTVCAVTLNDETKLLAFCKSLMSTR